jgi:hypothetical protein
MIGECLAPVALAAPTPTGTMRDDGCLGRLGERDAVCVLRPRPAALGQRIDALGQQRACFRVEPSRLGEADDIGAAQRHRPLAAVSFEAEHPIALLGADHVQQQSMPVAVFARAPCARLGRSQCHACLPVYLPAVASDQGLRENFQARR